MISENCGEDSVNDERKLQSTQNLKFLESIQHSQCALSQHTKRALLITAFILRLSFSKSSDIRDYSEWGS